MLTLDQATLHRSQRTLFQNVSMNIATGCITVVLGPNGAGKSSLLLALAGLLKLDSGRVDVDGKSLAEFSRQDIASRMAWLGELPPTEFGLTVVQRLLLAAGERVSNGAVQQAAASMDIERLLDRDLGQLSAGERQRVELAAITLRDCPIWLLDEPVSHLDLHHQQSTLEMLKKQTQQGRTIIIVLHDLHQATAVADHAILLDGKGGLASGKADAMMEIGRMQALFGSGLIVCETGSGMSFLAPDYLGGSHESS